MDYLSLEPCKGNIENVLMITDHFNRYAQAFQNKTQTTCTTVKKFGTTFSATVVFQRSLSHTRVEIMESELFGDVCKLVKVDKIRSTPIIL